MHQIPLIPVNASASFVMGLVASSDSEPSVAPNSPGITKKEPSRESCLDLGGDWSHVLPGPENRRGLVRDKHRVNHQLGGTFTRRA